MQVRTMMAKQKRNLPSTYSASKPKKEKRKVSSRMVEFKIPDTIHASKNDVSSSEDEVKKRIDDGDKSGLASPNSETIDLNAIGTM